MHRCRGLLPALVLVLGSGSALFLDAQSLADVARQTKRATQSQPAKQRVYTNEDLQGLKGTPGTEMLLVTTPVPTGGPTVIPPNVIYSPSDVGRSGGGEASWRQRADDAAGAKAKAEQDVEDLQNQLNLMTNQWSGADDPAWRDNLRHQMDLLIKKLDEAKQRLASATEKLQNLPDEARKANVPPGWVR